MDLSYYAKSKNSKLIRAFPIVKVLLAYTTFPYLEHKFNYRNLVLITHFLFEITLFINFPL